MKQSEQVPGCLAVRRIPDFNADKKAATGQDGLFDAWRLHAFFTTADPEVLDTVAADTTHRGHAVIEQINADLKASALAHLSSWIFTANAAWLMLAVMAFNLTRAASTLAGTGLAKATTATIRQKLITVAARIASSARRIVLHLPIAWPWEAAWTDLFNQVTDPPAPLAACLPQQPPHCATPRNPGTTRTARSATPSRLNQETSSNTATLTETATQR